MKNKKFILLGLVCTFFGVTSCSGFNLFLDDNNNSSGETQTTKEETQTKTDENKNKTYTSTFYSYGDVVFKKFTKKSGETVGASELYTQSSDKPTKPRDDTRHKDFTFRSYDNWRVLNGSHEGEVISISYGSEETGLDVDYDIEYEAVYNEVTAQYFVSFYNGDEFITTLSARYNGNLTSDETSKTKQNYYEPQGIVDGRLAEFAGWSKDRNASASNAILYKNLPKVIEDTKYYAIFKPVTTSSKLVYVVRKSNPAVYYDSEHELIKNPSNFGYYENVFNKFSSSAFALTPYGTYSIEVHFAHQNLFTSIGDAAFLNCSKIDKIDLGSKITSVGNSAFQRVEIGSFLSTGLTSIGTNCFQNSTLGSFPQLGQITTIPNSAFRAVQFLNKKITIPNNITTIDEYAFCQLRDTVDVISIPKNTTSIASNAFLPYYLNTSTDSTALPHKTNKIQEFSVASTNTKYSSVDGHLVDKTSRTLLILTNKNLTIPKSISTIAPYAVSGIDFDTLTIPATVTKISPSAFFVCTINTLIYEGGEDQFKNILESGNCFEGYGNTMVQFSDKRKKKLSEILASK